MISNKKILFSFLILFILLEIVGISFIAVWREWFWSSVSNKNLGLFIEYLIEFSMVVLVLVFVSGYKNYLVNYISLLFRNELTLEALKDIKKIEGYRQRLQEDCRDYPLLSITLATGLFSSILQIVIFSSILVYYTHFYNLGIVLVYALIGTSIASIIAKPLISLNYNNQVVEAKFRQKLNVLNLLKVYLNNLALFKKIKYLQYFQAFFNQVMVIIPLLILSVSYFKGNMQFGQLMQLSAIIASIIDQGSYFINSFDSINKWLSCKKRLKEMGIL